MQQDSGSLLIFNFQFSICLMEPVHPLRAGLYGGGCLRLFCHSAPPIGAVQGLAFIRLSSSAFLAHSTDDDDERATGPRGRRWMGTWEGLLKGF